MTTGNPEAVPTDLLGHLGFISGYAFQILGQEQFSSEIVSDVNSG